MKDGIGLPTGVTMREKKSGALSRMQKLRKRLSHSFGRLSVSKEDSEDHNHGKLPYNGYSDEFLDRLEPNGNIPAGKGDIRYELYNVSGHERVKRQLSVSSDSKLLDDDIREETKVILRPRKPPRPKSEVLLNQGSDHRRTKRYSAFGGDSPFGKTEAYIKLEQLGEGSYATVYKGFSK
jgi:cyclin-dependent kinase 14